MSCQPLIIGDAPGVVQVRLMAGEAAALVVPVTDSIPGLGVEWADAQGQLVASQSLALTGVDGDQDVWTLALTAVQVDGLAQARHARLVIPDPRRVVAAGRVVWLPGWSGTCTTTTPPLTVVGVPGRGVVSITDVDGDGTAQVLYTDGTSNDLELLDVQAAQAAATVAQGAATAAGLSADAAATSEGNASQSEQDAAQHASNAGNAAQLAQQMADDIAAMPAVSVAASPDHPEALRITYPAYLSPRAHVLRLPIGV